LDAATTSVPIVPTLCARTTGAADGDGVGVGVGDGVGEGEADGDAVAAGPLVWPPQAASTIAETARIAAARTALIIVAMI
jgi:hypothetical protein